MILSQGCRTGSGEVGLANVERSIGVAGSEAPARRPVELRGQPLPRRIPLDDYSIRAPSVEHRSPAPAIWTRGSRPKRLAGRADPSRRGTRGARSVQLEPRAPRLGDEDVRAGGRISRVAALSPPGASDSRADGGRAPQGTIATVARARVVRTATFIARTPPRMDGGGGRARREQARHDERCDHRPPQHAPQCRERQHEERA